MSRLYHITSRDNLDSIRKNGLVPQFGFLSDMVLEQYPAIYMFKELDEVAYAMKTWFGKTITYVYDAENLVLLQIELPNDIGFKERFGWEAVCYSTIPADCISVIEFPEY